MTLHCHLKRIGRSVQNSDEDDTITILWHTEIRSMPHAICNVITQLACDADDLVTHLRPFFQLAESRYVFHYKHTGLHAFDSIEECPNQFTAIVVRIHLSSDAKSLAGRTCEQYIDCALERIEFIDMLGNIALDHGADVVGPVDTPCLCCVSIKLISKYRVKARTVETDVQTAGPRKKRNSSELRLHRATLYLGRFVLPFTAPRTRYVRGAIILRSNFSYSTVLVQLLPFSARLSRSRPIMSCMSIALVIPASSAHALNSSYSAAVIEINAFLRFCGFGPRRGTDPPLSTADSPTTKPFPILDIYIILLWFR